MAEEMIAAVVAVATVAQSTAKAFRGTRNEADPVNLSVCDPVNHVISRIKSEFRLPDEKRRIGV